MAHESDRPMPSAGSQADSTVGNTTPNVIEVEPVVTDRVTPASDPHASGTMVPPPGAVDVTDPTTDHVDPATGAVVRSN